MHLQIGWCGWVWGKVGEYTEGCVANAFAGGDRLGCPSPSHSTADLTRPIGGRVGRAARPAAVESSGIGWGYMMESQNQPGRINCLHACPCPPARRHDKRHHIAVGPC